VSEATRVRHELYVRLLHHERYRMGALELERVPTPVEAARRRAFLESIPLHDDEPEVITVGGIDFPLEP
jgi:hypothetical protein